ncbi:ABC multidrug transporter [Apiospora aurea]|uniref:ABC multidrug transporter n=1 Tax=Apiospora aurea TaxID=335848 RepID=A0ABR1QL63_9PEZI
MSDSTKNNRLYTPRPTRVGGRVQDNGAGNEVVTVPSVVILSGGNGSSTDLLHSTPPPGRAASVVSKVSSASLAGSAGPSTRPASHHRIISLNASLGSIPKADKTDHGASSNGVPLATIQSATNRPPTGGNERPPNPLAQLPPARVPLLLHKPRRLTVRDPNHPTHPRIFSYTTTGARFVLASSVAASTCAGVAFPAMTIIFGRLVGNFASARATWEGETAQQMMKHTIDQNVLYIVYLFAGRFVLGYIATLGFQTMSLRISSAMRLAYLKALLGQRVSLLDTQPPGQIAAIITTTANTLQSGISDKLAAILQSLSLIVSAAIIAFLHSWKLTLVTGSGLLLITACYCITIPFITRNMKEVEDANIKASATANEALSSIRMIAACGAESKMVARYTRWVAESQRRGMSLSKVLAIQQATIYFSVFATFALAFWFAVRMLLGLEIPSVGTLIIVLMCVMMTVMTVGHISAPISAAARSAGAASILFNGIDAPLPKTSRLKGQEVSASQNIVLWNVNFTYPTRPKTKVLDELKLIIPAGKVTAIVGPSGSGKSTIVGLIERWYELDGDPDKNKLVAFFRNGSITVGSHRLHDIDLKWWRSQIGLVQQEPFLFNDTIFNNVANGLVGTVWENATEAKKRQLVEVACREAYADEFILRLPEGFDTSVGDAGIKLSGGQRQRIAIARSIVKQPTILILDEATSSIDVRGEKVVQAALDRVSRNRTTVMIAHRLSTVKKADNIVVLSKGKVVQWGNHESLMAQRGGPYWLLTNAQQLGMGHHGAGVGSNGEEGEEGASASAVADEMSDTAFTEADKRTMDLMTLDPGTVPGPSARVPGPKVYKPQGALRSLGGMLLEQKSLWPWYSILLVGALIAGASTPVQAYLFATLISSFAFWGETLVQITNFWCLMFVVVAAAVGVGYFALGFASTRIAFLVTTAYRREYFTNIISKPVSFFDAEGHSAGALTALLATDPAQLQQLLGTNMAFVTISLLSVTGCLAIAFYFGWKLTAVALSCAMPLALAAGFFRIRCEKALERDNLQVFAESARFATESVGAIRTVTALTLEERIAGRYERLLQEHVGRAFRKLRWATVVFAASDALPLLCMAFVLWYGGHLVVDGEYWTFNYLVVYIAVVQGAIGAGQWLSFGPNIAQANVAANRIQAMRVKENGDDSGMALHQEDFGDKAEGVRLELQNVWFRYPTRDVPVLCGLDMTIEKGQFAAIVGPSGCGKTSVISLLERFYDVKSGSIHMNGIDIKDIQLRDYRKSISLVAQEPSLFEGSIRENILLGVADESAVSDAELQRACREAEMHDFIASLPEGYDTKVGIKGVLLSGGQKQRLSIARALIRRPKLLLLDEATSNLDSETEKLIQGVFERTRQTRTMVVVAHRLATIQNADVIFVLGDGAVLEKGTHNSLLQKRGVYYGMRKHWTDDLKYEAAWGRSRCWMTA